MNKATKICIIVASALSGAGVILFAIGMLFAGFDFGGIDMQRFDMNVHNVQENFEHILIESDTADINLIASDDGNVRVECFEEKKVYHEVFVEDETLNIRIRDHRKWYDHIRLFNFRGPVITVYLPEGEYGDLTIDSHTGDVGIAQAFDFEEGRIALSTGDVRWNTASVDGVLQIESSTGNIEVKNAPVGKLKLSATTGNIHAEAVRCEGDVEIRTSTGNQRLIDVTCGNLFSKANTGDGYFEHMIAERHVTIKRSTGDTVLDRCDGAEFRIESDTGNVKGILLSEKLVFAESDTGSVNVPRSTQGGICEIETDTGDIRIEFVTE